MVAKEHRIYAHGAAFMRLVGIAIAVALFTGLLALYLGVHSGTFTVNNYPTAGRIIVLSLLGLLAAFLTLVMPAVSATAFTREREFNTLDALYLSRLPRK